MKNRTKKSISLLLTICLLVGTLLPVPVFGNGTPEATVTITPESILPSDKPQTVTVNISVSQPTELGGKYVIRYDPRLVYKSFESTHLQTIKREKIMVASKSRLAQNL